MLPPENRTTRALAKGSCGDLDQRWLLPIGEYASLRACRDAADTSIMISDEEPRTWQPFVAQWACVARPAEVIGRSQQR
jgi:hypothetical protein